MKRAGILIIVGIMAMCLAINASAAEKVTVYTSLETDETVKYLEAARRDMPDLEINIIRLSTGELGARMLAEKDNPQADLVWGWAVTNMEEFIPKGLLVPYKPKGVEKLEKRFVHPAVLLRRDRYVHCRLLREYQSSCRRRVCPCPRDGTTFSTRDSRGSSPCPIRWPPERDSSRSPASSRCTARKRGRKTAGSS